MGMGKRMLALLLAASMCGGTLPALAAEPSEPDGAGASGSGTIEATLRFDYRQTAQAVQERKITVSLLKGGVAVGQPQPLDGDTLSFDKYDAQVASRNVDGGPLGNEPYIGYYDLKIPALPADEAYQLEFKGEGYKTYRTKEISLAEHSQHVIVGTGDATFSIGDLNGDDEVTDADVELITAALGKEDAEATEKYDLNGDGVVDIVDLAYVNHLVRATGDEEQIPTGATITLEKLVDAEALKAAVNGEAENLFLDNGESVKVKSEDGEIALPIAFQESVETQQIELVTPSAAGAVLGGVAIVETADGEKRELPFNVETPAGVHALARDAERNTITIDLGARVPVKKVTIKVTKVEGDAGYAVVEQVKFLQDIVPENPTPKFTKVQRVTAEPGDKQVALRWTELPNVSGYRVDYETVDAPVKQGSMQVSVASALVSGLENLKAYRFIVTPTAEGWQGQPSDEVLATPKPASVPDAPDFLSVAELDGALRFSWQKSKNATGYRVYSREQGAQDWMRVGGDLTALNYMLSGLKNDTAYELCVSAFNAMGEGGKSKIVEGTPKALSFAEPEGIPTEGRMDADNFESVWLTDSGNVSPSSYPAGKPFKIENVTDGDYSTHWTSQSYGDGNFARNKQINCTFKEPVDLGNVIYVPRLDGDYRKNLKAYTITVWQEGDDLNGAGRLVAGGKANDVTTWWRVQNDPGQTGFAVLPFEPIENVKKISINMDQQAYTAISLSELIFLEYDPEKALDAQISGLFTDNLYTRLRQDVTKEELDALEARLSGDEKNYYLNVPTMQDELALAKQLFHGDDKIGRVLNGVESRNADGGQSYNGGQGGSALQPVGVAATANTQITVYADGIPAGAQVNLIATQNYAEASTWQKGVGTLQNGRNIFTVPKIGSFNTERGGSLYVTYTGEQPEKIRLHFRRTTDIPMLALADWNTLDESARRARIGAYLDEAAAYAAALPATKPQEQAKNVTEISLPHVLLSIPASSVQNALAAGDRDAKIEQLYQNALAWEQIMQIACKTQGIDDNSAMQARQNIRYMRMFAGAFMYAAGSHVGIGYGSCGGMVCGKPVETMAVDAGKNRLFGWGIAHEIGHNMDKLGKAEITNNIYSLMAQTYDGKQNTLQSRLEASGKYGDIFDKTSIAYPGAANDVFVQLGMYWQLHLAYDDGDSPMDFYNRFFKAWKQGGLNSAYSYDEKVAVTASKAAGRDLTEFFTRWGMQLGDTAKQEMAAHAQQETRALWYLNDESRRYRLANGAAGSGVTTAAAKPSTDDEKKVDLTFSSSMDADALQGFEIRRNGRSIAFVTKGAFTDLIGSANNQTFAYSVQAYDKLGNAVGAPADAGTVRIAYDKVIEAGAYTIEPTASGAVFKEATPVSGIKITPAPASGEFTVTVVNDHKTTVAKQGVFTGSEDGAYLAYFNKPGTSDTRIWTYDATEIQLTGVPEGAKVEFISYAGDNISFREDVTVGRLKDDYHYSSLDEKNQAITETIPAGTLVVVGSYRGDPVWNTIRIVGEYATVETDAETGEPVQKIESRPIPGEVLLFAEIPADGEVSDISDGFFLFVPDVQAEAALRPDGQNCDTPSALPARIKAELYRLDQVDDTESSRPTSDTLWISTPSADSMPDIILTGAAQ